ncbi:uncharacterized protein BDCG_16877 [Blastomyces dermatitidis ER-3]|nr:uncharacterized protein BDCG_16877 [Blastomyces dermatitidis ER-3]OAT01052.1 hypothetical protein BDCG_16877 [Blastomyces dermatitidis ER-3]
MQRKSQGKRKAKKKAVQHSHHPIHPIPKDPQPPSIQPFDTPCAAAWEARKQAGKFPFGAASYRGSPARLLLLPQHVPVNIHSTTELTRIPSPIQISHCSLK